MISIIMPVLNEAPSIVSALEHVFSLEGAFEVIVVDGGSTDGTVDLGSGYAQVLHGPRGRARQMNLGAAQARGDILLFLHADTRLPQGAIASVENALSDTKVVGGRFMLRLSDPGWAYRLIAFTINLRDRLLRGFTGDQAIFVRAEVFRALGGYREEPLMEDLDFGERLAKAGKIVRLSLKVTTSSRRWEKDGVAKTIFLMWTLRLLYALGFPPSRLKRFYGEIR